VISVVNQILEPVWLRTAKGTKGERRLYPGGLPISLFTPLSYLNDIKTNTMTLWTMCHLGNQCSKHLYPEEGKCSACQNLELLQYITQLNPETQSYTLDKQHERTAKDILSCHLSQLANKELHAITVTMGCTRGVRKWFGLICRNFIIFSLNKKQLLAQLILFLGYTLLPSPRELPDGFMEPYFTGVAIPVVDSCLYSLLASVEAVYPLQCSAACRCFLSTNFR
jgi:hypothetical protein